MGSKGLSALGGSRAAPWPCFLSAILVLALATGIAAAETVPEAEARVQAAKAQELRLAAERMAAVARLRGLETATAAAASRVAELAQRQREAELALARRTGEMAPMLPVMERLALYPAETLLAVPLPPEDAVRGLLVLGTISRQLEADAAAVRAGQAEAARLRQATEAQLPHLAAAQSEQVREATMLDAALGQTRAKRRAAEDDAAAAARQAAAEAAQAESLRAALARLEAERHAAEERARTEAVTADRQKREADAAAARRRQGGAGPAGRTRAGGGTRPVDRAGGRHHHTWLGRGWGLGPAKGATYGAAPGARVVSPCTGRVVFEVRSAATGFC